MTTTQPEQQSNRLVDLLKLGAEYLARHGVESSRLDAELLLSDMLGVARIDLYLNFDRPLVEEEKEVFRSLLRRRARGEPVQYILGYVEFFSRRFEVRAGVLIPRPETEHMVELAKDRMPRGGYKKALDAGCGSGVIALTLLKEGIAKYAAAVDIEEEAVRLTCQNAETLELKSESLSVVQADAFSDSYIHPDSPFDLVISNPPYIRLDEWDTLPPHVRDHEPRRALISGKDGLDAHRALAENLPNWLTGSGLFIGEIGAGQGDDAVRIHSSWAAEVKIHRDFAGYDRIVEATR